MPKSLFLIEFSNIILLRFYAEKMPSPLDIFWVIPIIPFFGALLIGILLLSFNRTMNRLSKPVAFILISCAFGSTIISYFLLSQELASEQIKDWVIDFQSLLGFYNLHIELIVNKLASIELAIISTISLILMFILHYIQYRKKNYVKY